MSSDLGERVRFRPRMARCVGLTLAGVILAGCCVLAVITSQVTPIDVVAFVLTGLLGAAFVARFATVYATAEANGLQIRNLGSRRFVPWDQIVHVTFGPNQPWVRLDLTDGNVQSVMAIQHSDGAFGAAGAQRLAQLVADRSSLPSEH